MSTNPPPDPASLPPPARIGQPPAGPPGAEPPRAGRTLLNRVGAQNGPTGPVKITENSTHSRLRGLLQARLVDELSGRETPSTEDIRKRISELVNDLAAEQHMIISRPERMRIIEVVTRDVLGLGPLEELLDDPAISEIMVNNAKKVYVERDGHMVKSPLVFEDNDQVMQIIDRIVARIGRRIDESSPMVDARLEDGSRVHIIIPPLALTGPTITIRKFGKDPMTAENLVDNATCTQDMMDFLRACVRARLNIAVAGGGTTGKTVTLNILSGFIHDDERIVTIEDAAELQLKQIHVVPLETRPANVEGRGAVTIRDLVINSLRMRPDRIVIGECRGPEALDMLQAMNTGHDGSLTTVHSSSARELISRLETLVLMAGTDLPSRAIREQISSAINIIVQQHRLHDGQRKIVSISEITGIDGDDVHIQDIFKYTQTAIDEDGKVVGSHAPTGIVPHFYEHLVSSGEDLPISMFNAPAEAGV